MHSSARLVTGIAAAVAVAALGLAPSAYAGDPGQLEITPATAAPGTTITVSTTACGPKGEGVGDAGDLGAGDFEVAPGTHQEDAVGRFTVPQGTEPGTYTIGVTCDNGKEADGDLEVTAGSSGWSKPETDQPSKPETDRPSGHVQTGVGGSVRPDTARIAAGVGVLAAAAAGGALLLRRRSQGG